ncbi:MAG: ABC transporter substrate-binding protein [Rhodospirillales bacterium]|nr:ABC transporter substrate-binding protein [Rhodospirillales bacterium]
MVSSWRGLQIAVVILGVAFAARAESVPETQMARDFIVEISAQIMDLATTEESAEARKPLLRKLFRQTLDFDTMSRVAAGKHWQRATPGQRARYQDVYADYIVNVYGDRLARESVEGIDIISSQMVSPDEFLITMNVNRVDHDPLTLGFRLRKNSDTFKIVDVITEGISLVLTQRTDFSRLLGNSEITVLIDALEKKHQENNNKT